MALPSLARLRLGETAARMSDGAEWAVLLASYASLYGLLELPGRFDKHGGTLLGEIADQDFLESAGRPGGFENDEVSTQLRLALENASAADRLDYCHQLDTVLEEIEEENFYGIEKSYTLFQKVRAMLLVAAQGQAEAGQDEERDALLDKLTAIKQAGFREALRVRPAQGAEAPVMPGLLASASLGALRTLEGKVRATIEAEYLEVRRLLKTFLVKENKVRLDALGRAVKMDYDFKAMDLAVTEAEGDVQQLFEKVAFVAEQTRALIEAAVRRMTVAVHAQKALPFHTFEGKELTEEQRGRLMKLFPKNLPRNSAPVLTTQQTWADNILFLYEALVCGYVKSLAVPGAERATQDDLPAKRKRDKDPFKLAAQKY